MTSVRVAHVITMLELGGAQQNTLYTVSHLNRSRFEPHLICGPGGVLDDSAKKANGNNLHFCNSLIREINPYLDWRAYQQMVNFFKELKPQIVHTHSSKAGVLGRLAAHRAGVPLIVHTYHGFGFHRFQNPFVFQLYLMAERRACKQTNHLVFVSQGNWDWAKELKLTRGNSASLIRSGVESQKFQQRKSNPEFRKENNIPADAKVIAMIACLKPQKDPVTFVRAADLVTQKRADAFFVLIGDGELRSSVEQEIAAMKHPERFRLLGWRYDVSELLGEIDLLALTSLWEGLPRVLAESTIAGVPSVASDIEGNREIVLEGKNGALAEPRNPAQFADQMIRCLKEQWKVDQDYRSEITRDFSIDETVRKQEELYDNLLADLSG